MLVETYQKSKILETNEVLEKTLQTRDIFLAPQYIQKLSLIHEVLSAENINFAVVGSVGLAITCNDSFDPFKGRPVIQNGKIKETMRDLDIVVLGNEEEKEKAVDLIQKINTRQKYEPVIDFVGSLNKIIFLKDGKYYLRRNDILTPVSKDVFENYEIFLTKHRLHVPVLHPTTLLLLLNLNNPISRISKIQKSMDLLKGYIASDRNDFPQIDKKITQQFNKQLIKTLFLDTGNISVEMLKKYYAKKIESRKNQWLKESVMFFKNG